MGQQASFRAGAPATVAAAALLSDCLVDDSRLAGQPVGAQPGRMAGWVLLALLAVADPASRERAGRASALVSYVAGDYAVAIGPRASAAAFKPAVSVDTGIAGIHEGGTAYRMDEVPLPLRPALAGPPTAAGTLRALRERLGA